MINATSSAVPLSPLFCRHLITAQHLLTKCNSQCRVSANDRQDRLETESCNLPANKLSVWTSGDKTCLPRADVSVPPLLQLVARSICYGNRRIPSVLEGTESICQPTVEPDRQSSSSGSVTAIRRNPSSTCLEDTTMVPNAYGNADYPQQMPSRVEITSNLHPTLTLPKLAMWPILGRNTKTSNFQKRLQHFSSGQTQTNHMTPVWEMAQLVFSMEL